MAGIIKIRQDKACTAPDKYPASFVNVWNDKIIAKEYANPLKVSRHNMIIEFAPKNSRNDFPIIFEKIMMVSEPETVQRMSLM